MTDPAVVSLRGVSKSFAKGGVTALQGIDLEVGRGEFVSLIGPSGCGKSTLLRIVGDIVEPSSGEVTVNGKPPRRAPSRRLVGREEHVVREPRQLPGLQAEAAVDLLLGELDTSAVQRLALLA